MRIFLDTANINEIRDAAKLGVLSGVTTNPSLISAEGSSDCKKVVGEIRKLVKGPISAEVTVEKADEMIKQAREIAGWTTDVAVKIPITAQGLEATSKLSKEGIMVNMTLCFSLNQAILAALAGATFVSPFIGRLDDIGHDGMELIRDIVETFDYYAMTTQVIAASIRHTQHCFMAAKAGAHIATVPYKVLMQMINHPLTDIGIARFLADWKKVSGA
ncbi:MAG: fructose-6-phosphate aldolase [Chloroflexota bacterium]